MKLMPNNWGEFQHYKDRAPAWIKLHKNLLDNFEFQCLPLASKALAPMLWLLASEYEGGVIDATPEKISFRLRISVSELMDAVNPLIDNGFFILEQSASEPLAPCLPREREEKEEEREKREIGSAKRAARKAPKDFTVTDELRAWAADKAPQVDLKTETEKLRDHTFSTARADWDGTWRNWMRKAQQDIERSRPQQSESFRARDSRAAAEKMAAYAPGIADRSHMPLTIDPEDFNVVPALNSN